MLESRPNGRLFPYLLRLAVLGVLVGPLGVRSRTLRICLAARDRVRVQGHLHVAVAGPVLGIDGVVDDRRVEPQAVALLAVVERGLVGAGPAPPPAAAPAAPAPARGRAFVVG